MMAAGLVLAALVSSTPARAQVFGQYTGATVVPVNGHVFGAYLNLSEHVIGGLAQLRLSFYPNLDFGFHGGLARLDPGGTITTRTTLRLGGDVRWQLTGLTGSFPGDLALGGNISVETADRYKVVTLGPSAVMSRTMGQTGSLVPYGGLALLFSSRDAFGVEDSDISVPLRLGLEGRISPEIRVVAELQLFIADRYNDDVGFVTGVNLPF
jgi:hypothetical protein